MARQCRMRRDDIQGGEIPPGDREWGAAMRHQERYEGWGRKQCSMVKWCPPI